MFPLADVLSHHQAHVASILAAMLPVSSVLPLRVPAGSVLAKPLLFFCWMNFGHREPEKLLFRKAVLPRRSLVDEKEPETFRVYHPGRKRSLRKEQAEHRFALAESFLSSAPGNRKSDMATDRLEKF